MTKKINSDGKSFWYWVLFLALITTGIFSFGVMKEQEKTYKLNVTLQQVNGMIGCLEQSQAPAVTVNALIKLIADQINPQLAAEQKIADSLNKKAKQ